MKIIALQGRGDTGKTTALKMLIEKMNTIAALDKFGPCADNAFRALPFSELLKCNTDMWATFNYKEIKIGITTRGDTKDLIKSDFARPSMRGCEILICAVRSNGATEEYVKSESSEYYIIHKAYINTNCRVHKNGLIDLVNTAEADNLIKMINTIC